MEERRRRILNLIKDSNIPLLNYRVTTPISKVHEKVVSDLLIALSAIGKEVLNYDHIQTTIPKQPYSLVHRGRRYDILYKDDGYYIFLEIKTTSLKPKQLKEDKKDGNS